MSSDPKRKQAKPYSGARVSSQESCVEALGFILHTHIHLSAPSPHTPNNAPGGLATAPSPHTPGKQRELVLSSHQLPLNKGEGTRQLFQELLSSCAAAEIDVLEYCVGCYVRASSAPRPSWDTDVWRDLSAVAMDTTALLTLQQLVQASSSPETNDLWSGLYGGRTVNRVLTGFLELLSGWSEGGLEVTAHMLHTIAAHAHTGHNREALVQLVKGGGQLLRQVTRLDELLVKESRTLSALDRLFSEPLVAELLAEELLNEIHFKSGAEFESSSLFSDLLGVTMVIDKLHAQLLGDKKYGCFLELRNYPNISSGDIISCHSQLQDALHRMHSTMHSALLKMLKSPHKNIVLGWLAAVVRLNTPRVGPRFRGQQAGGIQGVCSDGWMVNLCAVLLELCRPFFSSTSSGSKLSLIHSSYPSSPLCRLQLSKEPCLAGGSIEGGHDVEVSASGGFKFVTELFFLTQRALHVGLLPAVNQFTQTSSQLAKQLLATNMSSPNLKQLNSLHMLAGTCCLLDPLLVQYCSEFYITQAVWLTKLLEEHCTEAQQRSIFSTLPEHAVKDMALWFQFIVLSRPTLLQGLPLTAFVDCCVCLLERPDLLPSPLAQSRLVGVLLACLNSDRRAPQRLLGSEGWGGILAELSVLVQASPSVRDKLGPALLHTYAAVSVVEGLDVDKESFDKFATRYEVAQLLQRLWARDDARASIITQCSSKKFTAFLGAVLDTLLYQLSDGLSRLSNVHSCEAAKEGWSALSDRDRREKEVFLSGEQRAAKGFMTQASLQLDLLAMMTSNDGVVESLLDPQLVRRTTHTVLGLLETLCGPTSSDLKVADMDSYSFRPKALVCQLSSILVRGWELARGQSAGGQSSLFLQSIVEYPEYSASTMSKCVVILSSQQVALSTDMAQLSQQVESLQSLEADCLVDGAAPANHDWQNIADSSIIDSNGLCELYVSALEEVKYESAELVTSHLLADKLPPSLDPRSPKVRAILRDMKQLQESLPLHPDSAIFVRQDEDRMDLVRVLITGPTDTPYSRGCFVFDILYPSSYPTHPPLVFLTTTGGATIRFNPNLYADGKVCLSLLGTWHGGDASEKWDPLRSNLLQVLLSIQGMILISDPMFNEPGYEAIRGSQEGNDRSRHYNADLRVHTVRYAMLEQLRHPPKGFEDVIQVHFALQQEPLLKQLSDWLNHCISPEQQKRLRKAVDQLRALLD